ncbi:uncharacterized protein LOC131887614 [Tigriopus californicus]|uniref:uncharacterized protein LOC131887614 n=1 Tax=Tigriopus californicus TaxID=6832 RepID=UPI0027DA6034|nr:uncharacterized protein LOC131887614 [Tigriopus californicus]
MYSFIVEWAASKDHLIADALSRSPFFPPNESVETAIKRNDAHNPAVAVIFNNIDEEYRNLGDCAARGTLDDPALAHFHQGFGEISMEEGIVRKGNCLFISRTAGRAIVDLLHLSYSGVVKTTEHARQLFFWPGMANDICQRIAVCEACLKALPAQPHEPIQTTTAMSPMERVGVDIFELGGLFFLIMVDCYSRFLFVARLTSTTRTTVCNTLMNWFSNVGLPKHLKLDNGPQFRGPFTAFCEELGIIHETSSPYNPRSNGLAEEAIKNMKSLLKKSGASITSRTFQESLLAWRVTPRADGFSPAFVFLADIYARGYLMADGFSPAFVFLADIYARGYLMAAPMCPQMMNSAEPAWRPVWLLHALLEAMFYPPHCWGPGSPSGRHLGYLAYWGCYHRNL